MSKQQLSFIPPINDEDNWLTKNNKNTNRHHIIPKYRTPWEKDTPTIRLYQDLHNAFHRVFGTGVFQEQIEQLLKINWPALSDKYRKDIEEVINMSDDYVYRNGIYIKR